MVVDSSAVVAIMTGAPEGERLKAALDRSRRSLISGGTAVELGIVLEGRGGLGATGMSERFLRDSRVQLVPVAEEHVDRALEGWRRFGKGRHPAQLNFGDCFTYALAATTGLPVLCVGNGFARTDVAVVDLDAAAEPD